MKKGRRERFQYGELLKEIEQSHPRASFLIAAALVDDMLTGAIKYNLVTLSKNESADLFDYPGPLSAFSAKIKMGSALGLYGKKLREDLNAIRKLRNDFAHSFDKVDPEHSSIKNLLLELHSVRGLRTKKSKTSQQILSCD
jgi:mannitol operon repressor